MNNQPESTSSQVPRTDPCSSSPASELTTAASDLSPTGQKLFDNIQKVALEAKQTVSLLSQDESAKETIHHATKLSKELGNLTLKDSEMTDKTNRAIQSLLELSRTLVMNFEFRALVKDIVYVFGDILMENVEERVVSAAEQPETSLVSSDAPEARATKSEKLLPTESKDMIQEKIVALLKKIAATKPELHSSIGASVLVYDLLQEKILQETSQESPGIPQEFTKTLENAKQFMENRVKQPIDPLINSFLSWFRAIHQENIFESLRPLYLELRNNPDAVNSDEFRENVNDWLNSFRAILSKYREQGQRMIEEMVSFMERLPKAPLIEHAQELKATITSEVAEAFESREKFQNLAKELQHDSMVLWDRLSKFLATIKVPRVDINNQDYHIVVDNIELQCNSILPSNLVFTTCTEINSSSMNQVVQMNASGIQAKASNVTWMFFKKSGLFSAGDVGLADLSVKDQGLEITVTIIPVLNTVENEPSVTLISNNSKVTLHSLDLLLHETQHDWLYAIMNPVIESQLKSFVQDYVQETLDALFTQDFRSEITTKSMEAVQEYLLPAQ